MIIYIDKNLNSAECLFSTSKLSPFVAISVGSKPPCLEKAIDILRWLLLSNSESIPILIADEIAHINYRGFGYSTGKVLNQVAAAMEKQLSVWGNALNHLTDQDKLRFKMVYWSEIVNPKFIEQQNIIRSAFAEQAELYEEILFLVEVFIKSTGKTVNSKRKTIMAEYVIQELPLLLFGIQLDDVNYRMMLYPTYYSSEMVSMISAIRRKPCYSKLLISLRGDKLEHNKIIQMIVQENDGVESQIATKKSYSKKEDCINFDITQEYQNA